MNDAEYWMEDFDRVLNERVELFDVLDRHLFDHANLENIQTVFEEVAKLHPDCKNFELIQDDWYNRTRLIMVGYRDWTDEEYMKWLKKELISRRHNLKNPELEKNREMERQEIKRRLNELYGVDDD